MGKQSGIELIKLSPQKVRRKDELTGLRDVDYCLVKEIPRESREAPLPNHGNGTSLCSHDPSPLRAGT